MRGSEGREKKGMIILVLQYWTSFNPHHVLMSLWWCHTPQLPPTHTLWRQTGTRADAASMKTDLTQPPRAGNAGVQSVWLLLFLLSRVYTCFHTCIIFKCFWYLRWIPLAYKCDLALIICVWMDNISTAILCACVHTAPKQLDRAHSIRLTFSQEHHQVDMMLCLWDAGRPGDQDFPPCPNIPPVLLQFFTIAEARFWKQDSVFQNTTH